MKKLLSFLFSIQFVFNYAQVVNVKQTSSLSGGGNNIMSTFGVAYTANKNFIFGYRSMLGGNNILRINSQGDTVFTKLPNTSNFSQLTATSDGSVYGFYSPGSDSLVIHKFSAMGVRKWQRKIVLPAGGNWNGLSVTDNGIQNVFCMGSNYWANGGHALIGKLDSSGTPVFTKSIDMSSWFGTNVYNVNPTAVKITSAGNILVLGTTYANNGTPQYLFLIMFNPAGNVLWTKTYQTSVGGVGSPAISPISLNLTSANEILIAGEGQSYTGTTYMRLDQNGNLLWAKSIADNSQGCQLIGLSNGNLALHIANSNQVVDAIPKNMISILDPSGNVKLTRSFGYSNSGSIAAIGEDVSTNIVALGYSGSYQELYIYSIDTAGNSTGCYDVIGTLPVTTWTPNFVSQTLSAATETISPVYNQAITVFPSATFTKSSPAIQANGVITKPLCHGTFGSVTLNPSGGTSPYSYKWSNGTNSQNLLNIPGGIYVVRISDNKACVELDTFNVIEPPALATTYTVTHVTCFGMHNGSIHVTVSGGTPGYNYQWTTQATTPNLSNLSGGFYQLTITDTNNCTKTLAVSVNEPQQLIAGIISSQNVKCHGACNGSLTGIASGGTTPYTYLWNNTGNSTTTNISNLCPGNYLFSVTDSKNCNTFSNAVITEPSALSISTSTAGSLCGVSTGEASAAVAGGVSPYTYQWSNTTTNDTAFNLSAGTYSVNAHDANNCPISASVNVGLVTPVSQLCMVTVDSLSSHNILLWNKTGLSHIAYFNIYREDITNNYTLIAAVNYDSLSEYHDHDTLMANPNITTKRYKISAVDSCGSESTKSNFHNTIFIAHNNGTFTWNTYTIQNTPNPVTSYLLMRDNLSNGNWQQIGTTAGTQNILNDPNYTSFQTTASWRVETVWGISCTATMRESNGAMGAIIKSKSNIVNNRQIGIKESAIGNFGIYPNPANDFLTIILDKQGNNNVEIINTLGETVKQINIGETQNKISISDLASGIYYVKVFTSGKQLSVSRIVIQR
ncbi:MAG TPA: T9SS type A sorting domain-containing protein [Bacteroidia bacterium]|jgi:hypothetical protein|nr:T9SS type A sorting domain-containing protein [Bacteroidia bacterium]